MTFVPPTRVARPPNWFDSLLFLALMSGPPKFRARDPFASLEGAVDLVVLFHTATWVCGGLWVLANVYPTALRRGAVPAVNPAQVIAALFIAALALSAWESPGILLTAFTLGQFAVMLGFTWVFTHRFGAATWLRHLFVGVSVLALATIAAVYVAPELVTDETFVLGQTRLRGDNIADTASIAVIGLVCCLASTPPLRGPWFWAALSLFGALLAASRTRSAFVALLVFLAIGFIHGRRLPVRKLVVPLVALTLGVVLVDALPSAIDYVVRERESVETMSDRIPLWQYLTSAVMREAPLMGLGYYSASRLLATEYNPLLGNAHSVFFEVLVGGGVLGVVLYVVLCGFLVRCALRLLWVASGQPTAVATVGLLFAALTMGLTSLVALHAGPLGFVFWSTTALLPELSRAGARARLSDQQRFHATTAAQRFGAAGRVAILNRQAESDHTISRAPLNHRS